MCVCIYTNICMRNVYNLYIYITHKYWESSLCYMPSTCRRFRVLLTEAALDWMTSCHTHRVSRPTMWTRLVIFLSPKCLRGNAVWWSRSGQGWWMGFLPRYQQHGCLLAWSADREAQVKESEPPTEPVPPENMHVWFMLTDLFFRNVRACSMLILHWNVLDPLSRG